MKTKLPWLLMLAALCLPLLANAQTDALLLVTDTQGRVVLSRLAGTGAGNWRIAAQTLQVGVYHYTLVIDGVTIATKKMVIVN